MSYTQNNPLPPRGWISPRCPSSQSRCTPPYPPTKRLWREQCDPKRVTWAAAHSFLQSGQVFHTGKLRFESKNIEQTRKKQGREGEVRVCVLCLRVVGSCPRLISFSPCVINQRGADPGAKEVYPFRPRLQSSPCERPRFNPARSLHTLRAERGRRRARSIAVFFPGHGRDAKGEKSQSSETPAQLLFFFVPPHRPESSARGGSYRAIAPVFRDTSPGRKRGRKVEMPLGKSGE